MLLGLDNYSIANCTLMYIINCTCILLYITNCTLLYITIHYNTVLPPIHYYMYMYITIHVDTVLTVYHLMQLHHVIVFIHHYLILILKYYKLNILLMQQFSYTLLTLSARKETILNSIHIGCDDFIHLCNVVLIKVFNTF